MRDVYKRQSTNSRESRERPSGYDALQALLAFSALHQQVRQRRALASAHRGFEKLPRVAEFESQEQFVLDEVLQLVAERAISITGADGLGIALAENNEIVLRASAGIIKPDLGARIQRDSAFSGASFRTAQIIRCDEMCIRDRRRRATARRRSESTTVRRGARRAPRSAALVSRPWPRCRRSASAFRECWWGRAALQAQSQSAIPARPR